MDQSGLEVHIAYVKKALGSVRKMCEAGNIVVSDDGGSCVENKERKEGTALVKEKGSYILTMWIPPRKLCTKMDQHNISHAGILGMTQPDLVRPLVTEVHEGMRVEASRPSAEYQQEHQDRAFWRALEPLQPVEEEESGEAHTQIIMSAQAKAALVPQVPSRQDFGRAFDHTLAIPQLV